MMWLYVSDILSTSIKSGSVCRASGNKLGNTQSKKQKPNRNGQIDCVLTAEVNSEIESEQTSDFINH